VLTTGFQKIWFLVSISRGANARLAPHCGRPWTQTITQIPPETYYL